jgi:hypothetical protein
VRKPQISPLRYAPVEMTKLAEPERFALPEFSNRGVKAFEVSFSPFRSYFRVPLLCGLVDEL